MGWHGSGGLTATEKAKLAKIDVGLKSNLNATSAPTKTDDITKDYGIGSTWKYGSVTYVCGNNLKDNAEWAPTTDIYYFNTWAELIAAISVAGTTYLNKYASVANANGGPSGGTTYTAPGQVTTPIDDGGSAAYKIVAQGTNYSVICQPRTITNPVVRAIMVLASALPTIPGYYIFTVTPINGLPVGIGLNDIAYFNGTTWSLFQLYSKASTVLVATDRTGYVSVTWRKFNGTWMSTADEYNTDRIEYQTSKLWNGKPVYRKGMQGTTNIQPGVTLPTVFKLVSIWMVVQRSDSIWVEIMASGNEAMICIDGNRAVNIWVGNTELYGSRPYYAWVEYTKS
jgi:hypothetical protein